MSNDQQAVVISKCPAIRKIDGLPCGNDGNPCFGGFCLSHVDWTKKGNYTVGDDTTAVVAANKDKTVAFLKCPAIKKDGIPCRLDGLPRFEGFCKWHADWKKKGNYVVGDDISAVTFGKEKTAAKDRSPQTAAKARSPQTTLTLTYHPDKPVPIELIQQLSSYGSLKIATKGVIQQPAPVEDV